MSNPLYRNEYYFFSNMYDDSLITDFYRKISAGSFERSVSYQQNMLGRKRHRLNSEIFYKSTLGEFKIDDRYNASIGLPPGTRTLRFNRMILPVFNKKKFLSTYGLQYQKIPLIDFLKRNDIFDKSVRLQIGKYFIIGAYFILNADKTVTLAIYNSNTDGISATNFEKIIAEYGSDEPVWVFSEEITKAYYFDTTATASVSNSTISGYYDVKVPKTANVNNIGSSRIGEEFNSWDCLISIDSTNLGRKVLVSSPGSLRTTTSTHMVFAVSKQFIDMVKTHGINFGIWFINKPNKKHLLLYPYNKDTSPILNLDYTYNPSGNINIEVFEIDSSTMCKGRKLYDPEFTQIYFPNIFDFSELNKNNSDLLIEVTEYGPAYTNQIMNNSIQPLIESLGPELYTEFVVNGHDKSVDGISMDLKNYHPEYHPVDFDEFINSEYKDDYRGYILDKINKTIESDPFLIASYYKWMMDRNTKVTTTSGTPKTFRFGTRKNGEFSGINKIVMDTSIASIISDDIQYFTEEHSYITYYNSNEKCPASVYVDGKYIRPTCSRHYKGLNYLFFPIRVINDAMSKYKTDADVVAASPITVDSYPNTYSSFNDAPVDRFTIGSVTESIKIFEHLDSPMFTLDELVLYNNSTGEYLGSIFDLFEVNLTVSEYQIEHPEVTNSILLERGKSPEYLLTALGEIYNTMDYTPIILSGNEVKLSFNGFINELIDEGVIDESGKNAFTHKKINFNDIELVPKSSDLIGMSITVFSRAFKQEWIVRTNNGRYDSINDITTYEIMNAHIDNDMNRYFIYIDGLFDTTAKLTPMTNVFNGKLKLTLPGDQTSKNSEIIISHIPISYKMDDFHFQNRVFYMKPAVKTEVDTDKLWPKSSEDGVILQTYTDRIYNSFAFENDVNIKFDHTGRRLPPKSKTTNSLYRQYYDNNRAMMYGLGSTENTGTVLYLDIDVPIMDIAKQNPYAVAFDENFVKNPLDILTHIEKV